MKPSSHRPTIAQSRALSRSLRSLTSTICSPLPTCKMLPCRHLDTCLSASKLSRSRSRSPGKPPPSSPRFATLNMSASRTSNLPSSTFSMRRCTCTRRHSSCTRRHMIPCGQSASRLSSVMLTKAPCDRFSQPTLISLQPQEPPPTRLAKAQVISRRLGVDPLAALQIHPSDKLKGNLPHHSNGLARPNRSNRHSSRGKDLALRGLPNNNSSSSSSKDNGD